MVLVVWMAVDCTQAPQAGQDSPDCPEDWAGCTPRSLSAWKRKGSREDQNDSQGWSGSRQTNDADNAGRETSTRKVGQRTGKRDRKGAGNKG